MRADELSTKLHGMETLITVGMLVVALIPLVVTVRALAAHDKQQAANAVAAFYKDETTIPMPGAPKRRELAEETASTFVKRAEWWTE